MTLLLVVHLASPALTEADVNYVYDSLGRLTAVIDEQGDVAVYHYDAVGNVLSIDRINASTEPGSVAISLVTPNSGRVGTTVAIFGKGFSATPSQNALAFNGTAATVTEAAPNRLVTSVPLGATTGSISLTTPLGHATSPGAFTVIGVTGPLVVTPAMALVLPGRTQQFNAVLNGAPTSNVTWAVNGIPGGDTAVGTISPGGLYLAPSGQTVATAVTVTATHAEDVLLAASAMAMVVAPAPILTAASVAVAELQAVDRNLAIAGSVVVSPISTVSNNLVTAASVQTAPVITGVAPSTATRGTSGLTVTLSGVGFTGATAVDLRLGNAADPSITTSSLTVISDTQLTVSVSVDTSAVVGLRVVQVTTPSGSSTVTGTGSNLFTVQ